MRAQQSAGRSRSSGASGNSSPFAHQIDVPFSPRFLVKSNMSTMRFIQRRGSPEAAPVVPTPKQAPLTCPHEDEPQRHRQGSCPFSPGRAPARRRAPSHRRRHLGTSAGRGAVAPGPGAYLAALYGANGCVYMWAALPVHVWLCAPQHAVNCLYGGKGPAQAASPPVASTNDGCCSAVAGLC